MKRSMFHMAFMFCLSSTALAYDPGRALQGFARDRSMGDVIRLLYLRAHDNDSRRYLQELNAIVAGKSIPNFTVDRESYKFNEIPVPLKFFKTDHGEFGYRIGAEVWTSRTNKPLKDNLDSLQATLIRAALARRFSVFSLFVSDASARTKTVNCDSFGISTWIACNSDTISSIAGWAFFAGSVVACWNMALGFGKLGRVHPLVGAPLCSGALAANLAMLASAAKAKGLVPERMTCGEPRGKDHSVTFQYPGGNGTDQFSFFRNSETENSVSNIRVNGLAVSGTSYLSTGFAVLNNICQEPEKVKQLNAVLALAKEADAGLRSTESPQGPGTQSGARQ